ncbi:hypothetical protein [Streptomyces kanamyceticus]|uniref:Uncharacterized protein n=1 Tax=Streptomyces kanamyceticus TaxID=1967 RepID=A0A5J6GF57_STRKN|nr:hypothetical protein [Streptomyces kanamyceticus]QEU92495.1 hypothetical protein CP970_17680 [Streptomyces kanamyceticus]
MQRVRPRLRERLAQRLSGTAPAPPQDAGGGPAATNGQPFDYRVRVLVEIHRDPDELALAEEVLAGRGWPVRAPKPGEYAPDEVTEGYVPRIVEVRLLGARDGAAQQALHMVMDLSKAMELALHVRDAALIQHRPDPHITWEIHPRRVPGPRERFRRFWADDGTDDAAPRPLRVIRIPEQAPESDALAAAASHSPAWPPFDAAEHAVRPARINRLSPAWWGQAFLALVTVAAALLAIRHLHLPDEPAPVGYSVLFSVGISAMGLLTSVFGAGAWFALRQSSALRHVLPWALPVALPAAFAAVPQVGQLLHTSYLSAFDLSGEVEGGGWSDALRAGLLLTGAALYGLLIGLGAGGWVYRTTARSGTPFGLTLFIGVYAGLAAGLVLANTVMERAGDSGDDARATAAAYRTPGSYYGLEPEFVCVLPKGKEPPIYGGRLPTGRPLLTFGPKGDRVSLWDPKAERALGMRLEDATFVPAKTEHGKAICPRTP